MIPRTMLRIAAVTARDAVACAIADAVQAKDVPISSPAPMITPSMPCAAASDAKPARYSTAPPTRIGRKPRRTTNAPAIACKNPHARFWMESANVKSETVSAKSLVTGCTNNPKDCRMPILKVNITAAPIRIGRTGRRVRKSAIEKPLAYQADDAGADPRDH
jgi:hypothetical protein